MRKFKEKAREKVGEVKKKAEEKVLGLGDLRPTASTVEGDTTIWNVDKYVGIVQGQDKWSAAQLNISSTHINLSAQDRDTSIFLATDFDVRCVANSRQIDFNCKRGNYPRSQTIFFRIRARNEQQLTEITELANKNIESSRIQQEEKAREAQRQEEEKRAKAAEEYRRQKEQEDAAERQAHILEHRKVRSCPNCNSTGPSNIWMCWDQRCLHPLCITCYERKHGMINRKKGMYCDQGHSLHSGGFYAFCMGDCCC